jgi:SAM-dependent methyltransferase
VHFDGARVERTLQHVEDPVRVLGEMVRVLRPGGIIVAAEPDWGTLVIDSGEREGTRALVREISDNQIRNGWIGRQLPGNFVLLGLESIEVSAGIFSLRSLDLAADIFGFAGVAGDSWLQEMRERDSRGVFFASVTGFVVKGRRAETRG